MPNAGLAIVVHHLRTTLAPSGATDRDLLARFAAGGDAAAFTELVMRHGPMVLGVCRRVLRHEQDAEDAFQAVFLVLAQKARSLHLSGTAAPWLYEVATRTALRARTTITRRRARETQVEELPQPTVEPPEPRDWQVLLDEELARLPEKYRAVVVLCELEGRSRKEAARLLGVPEGTVSSRLAAARKLLARRLARRGVTPAGVLLVEAVTVPPALVESTVRTVMLVTAGMEVAAAGPAVALMKGVLRTMFVAKLKWAMLAVLAILVGLVGVGGFPSQGGRPAQASAQTEKAPTDLDVLRKEIELLKLKVQVLENKVRAQEAQLKALRQATGISASDKQRLADLEMARIKQRRFANLEMARIKELEDRRTVEANTKLQAAKMRADLANRIDAAAKWLREAKDEKSRHDALEELDRATKKLRELMQKGDRRSAPPK
jgi:RNA polymerase sigma factor (sigma-70 family)